MDLISQFFRNKISKEKINSVWNIIYKHLNQGVDFTEPLYGKWKKETKEIISNIWCDFFKLRIDEMGFKPLETLTKVSELFVELKSIDFYKFIEFFLSQLKYEEKIIFTNSCNKILERENSDHRIIGDEISNIISNDEITSMAG